MSVHQLHDALGADLMLKWVAGRNFADKRLVRDEDASEAGIVGFFNMIHSNQIQVLGKTELHYLAKLSPGALQTAYGKLCDPDTAVVVIADGCLPPADMADLLRLRGLGLLRSNLAGERLVGDLRYYLTRTLAAKTTLHGVFMEVISIGLLLTGASAVGKSELALELITRGHRLIADDAPAFARIAPDIIVGTSPPIIQDFLEVRGLGVLNIRKMYGDSAIKTSKYLKLIVDLQPFRTGADAPAVDRLAADASTRRVLGMDIPVFTLPVAPGRNLAVLVEAAVRNHIMRATGDRADLELSRRQVKQMQEGA